MLIGNLADRVIERIDDRQGILWVGRVGEAGLSVGIEAVSVSHFVFDSDSDEIDREAMGVWLPGYDAGFRDLLTSSALYEGEVVCSG